MIHINTTSLAFYSRLDQQSHRLGYAYGGVYSLVCSTSRLLPFQVIVETTFPTVTAVLLRNIHGATWSGLNCYFFNCTELKRVKNILIHI